jgi:hypothetical protein
MSDSGPLEPLYLFAFVRVRKLDILCQWRFRIIGSGDALLHSHNISLLEFSFSYEVACQPCICIANHFQSSNNVYRAIFQISVG